MSRTDEEVYKALIKERQKRQETTIAVLAFLLVIFIVATIILSVLYFGSGNVVKETDIKVYTDGGKIQNTNINSYQSAANGDVEVKETNSHFIVLFVISGMFIVFTGVGCLLYCTKKQKY